MAYLRYQTHPFGEIEKIDEPGYRLDTFPRVN